MTSFGPNRLDSYESTSVVARVYLKCRSINSDEISLNTLSLYVVTSRDFFSCQRCRENCTEMISGLEFNIRLIQTFGDHVSLLAWHWHWFITWRLFFGRKKSPRSKLIEIQRGNPLLVVNSLNSLHAKDDGKIKISNLTSQHLSMSSIM